jgi:GTP 3',8-cyclase
MLERATKGFKKAFFAITEIELYKLVIRKSNAIKSIRALLRFRQWPMFHWIQIETSTYCNRKCHGCPNATFPREKDFISDETFTKIIDDLVGLKFSGIIHLHSFNEPLADRTIVEKVCLISKRLPKARIEMNSNGDFLTLKLLSQLASAGLGELYVTQYDGKVSDRLLKILEKAGNREREILAVRVKSDSDFVGNRAGILNNVTISEPILGGCNRPFNQMVINYKGDVIICCNDYFGKEVLGNVENDRLLDIWSCHRFKTIRRLLRMKRRNCIELCRSCNFMGDIYSYRDLSDSEIRELNMKVRLKDGNWKILPKILKGSVDILRAHSWV